MKTMSNMSGNYGALQGADSQGNPKVFGVAATIAVLVVSSVVGFKMAGPDAKAAVLNYLPVAVQPVSMQSVSASVLRVDTPAHNLAIGEH